MTSTMSSEYMVPY